MAVAEAQESAPDWMEQIGALDERTPAPGPWTNQPEVVEEPEAVKKSAAVILVELAQERYRFGVSDSGEPFGVRLDGGHVVRMLRGGRTSLRAELAKAYRQRTGKVAGQQALADALLALEGEAQESDPKPVHLRVAQTDAATWIDLGDTEERVVRLDATGWSVVTSGVPVLFRRTALTGVLPVPASDGDLDELWSLVNVTEADRPMVLAWLVAALLLPGIPHPILALFGEQGSGKSTASRLFVQLVDPSPVPLRKPPRDADGWVTAAAGSYVVGLDNLSTVPDWLSDSLCRAATGEGDVRRQLYTDGQLAVFSFRRVLLLNGIDVGAMRGDLAERLVLVNVERITETGRLTETELAARWERAYPALFGALLDLVAGLAGKIPSVRLGTSPRMADFARVLAAVDDRLSTSGLARFAEQARTMAEDSLDADPFLAILRGFPPGWSFTGTAAELRTEVTPTLESWRPPREWPKNARQVTSRLRRNAPALRKAGWVVEDQGTANKAGVTTWRLVAREMSQEGAPKSSPPPPPSLPSQVSGLPEAGKAGNGGEAQPRPGREAGLAGKENGQSQDETPTCALCSRPIDGPKAEPGQPRCLGCGRQEPAA